MSASDFRIAAGCSGTISNGAGLAMLGKAVGAGVAVIGAGLGIGRIGGT